MKNSGRTNQTDEVTGLFNMMHFMEDAHYLLQEAVNNPIANPIAFVYFDVENFKSFNLKYGFQGGNKLLQHIAFALRDTFSDGLIARLNDDHFVVAVENRDVIRRIDFLRRVINTYDEDGFIEVKAGIYVPASEIRDIALIMDRAKLACESVKGKYDAGWSYYDASLEEKIRIRHYIINNFYQAMENHRIEVWYQPEIRTMTREIVGFEALVRWNSSTYGMMSPNVFIEVLEDAHLIHKLDLYVIRRVCEDCLHIREHGQGWQESRISVNLSRMDFQLTDIFQEVEKIRQEYGLSCDRLHIEITESALSADDKNLLEQMAKFREAGYEIWMDDFGSGYSSLNNLKDYDFDFIKFDMRFLRDFCQNSKAKVILRSLVNMGKELGIHTLCEGVETEEQYQFLKNIGCELCQGYLFGKPEPLEKAENRCAGKDAVLRFEPLVSSAYFQTIGAINVLSSFPLQTLEKRKESTNQLALAIIEQGESMESLRYLYFNKAFKEQLHGLGISDVREFVERYQQAVEHSDKMFARLLERCRQSQQEESVDFIMEGRVGSIHCKYIATDPVRQMHAYALIMMNLSKKSGSKDIDIYAAIHHILAIFTRVDFFTRDGQAKNFYIDETQDRITTDSLSMRSAVCAYARRYIVREERKEYLRFYDFSTLQDRKAQIKRDHFTAFFHTKNNRGEVKLKMYLLIPLRFKGMEGVLSCVCVMDGASRLKNIQAGEVAD